MEPPTSNISRFEEFKELEDNSGFKIPTGEVFKFDKHFGWFDEYGDYFNADGEPSNPPKDSLKIKKKLMDDQRLLTKVKNKVYDQYDNEDIPEYYDVVSLCFFLGLYYQSRFVLICRIMMIMIKSLIICPMGTLMMM